MKKFILPILSILPIVANFFLPYSREVVLKAQDVSPNIVEKKYVFAHNYLESLNHKEKAGQTMIINISGTTLTEPTKEFLNEIKPGGIILYTTNIQSSQQTKKLTADLQNWAKDSGLPPLFIAIDEEGGVVERLSFAPAQYSQPQLGQIDSEEQTRKTAHEIASTLEDLGINMNFAPVADIAFSTSSFLALRAFGNNPDLVSKHVGWTVDEYNKTNVLTIVKHFPGHGRTSGDSHFITPSIPIDLETWRDAEEKPFQTAIENNADGMMTGHTLYPYIDDEIGSKSKFWIDETLKKELKFEGLIITDNITMLGTGRDVFQSSTTALKAGNHMILCTSTTGTTEGILESLYTDIEEEYLNNTVLKILEKKYATEEHDTIP
ncbi:glycoside hydrolase family 3 protein [Candidatus Dojkabacteria bacterium]|nr:glycoside hydrolase family 3 protein [Candidatus Dojkabacteria bacterium]